MTASTDVVAIQSGQISGVVDRGVRVFKGLPYAAAPVGDLRWKPPQPVPPWTGIRDASRYGAECSQTQYSTGSVYIRPLQPQSEDCLFLNVWTMASAGESRPVFVWIHGGALTKGSSISDTRDGVPLAQRGIVLVSINYRLGPLGYLAHPELSAESPHKASGNYGVLDQIAALQWVQKNITAFGGDPGRVTIGGESAGSWSVNTLVASPLAKGLFIRAIGQSGGRFSRTPHLTEDRGSQQSAEAAGLAYARALGADSLAALRAIPADTLVRQSIRTQENVDGWVLPGEIRTIFAEKKHNNVPVIVGSTADEMTSLGGAGNAPTTLEEFRKRLTQQYGELATEFIPSRPSRISSSARPFVRGITCSSASWTFSNALSPEGGESRSTEVTEDIEPRSQAPGLRTQASGPRSQASGRKTHKAEFGARDRLHRSGHALQHGAVAVFNGEFRDPRKEQRSAVFLDIKRHRFPRVFRILRFL